MVLEKYQFLLSLSSGGVPSILAILAGMNNNARLNRVESGLDALSKRVEAGLDALNRRMDDQVQGFHSDMISFQAAILESNFQLRERVAIVEAQITNRS